MTVISTVISKYCIAFASDSLITQSQQDGTRKGLEYQKSKLIRVPKLRGILAYYGLAQLCGQSTFDWLSSQACLAGNYGNAEDFAYALRDGLASEISRMKFASETEAGIGIQLGCYECVRGYRIPELFHIRNWADPSYSSLFLDGIRVSGDTYAVFAGKPSESKDRIEECRLQVKDFLDAGHIFVFNNGSPSLFNRVFHSISAMIRESKNVGNLASMKTADKWRDLARVPVKFVRDFQRDFYRPGKKLVEGKVHNLSVTPQGEFETSSGD